MTDKRVSQIEKELSILKKKYELKKITHREFKESLKKLRFKDDLGKYWTIGVQSGDWYYFDGTSWIKSHPPSFKMGKAICIYCGYENDLRNESCVQCGGHMDSDAKRCPDCDTRLRDDSLECPFCSNKHKFLEREAEEDEETNNPEAGAEFVFHSLNSLSFLLFWGVIGLVSGILLGAYSGVSGSFSATIQYFPEFLKALQGKILGGIVFGIIGAVSGFILLAVCGFIAAGLINFVLSLVGGIRMRVSRPE